MTPEDLTAAHASARPSHADTARAVRAAARTRAEHAIRIWRGEVLTALGDTIDDHLSPGTNRVALFTATTHLPGHDQDTAATYLAGTVHPGDIHDQLTTVTLASSAGRTELTTTDPTWTDLVDLWNDLRDALETETRSTQPAAMLVDLDHGPDTTVVYLWEPYYCPDTADDIPCPDNVIELAPDPNLGDPFAALLADPDPDGELLLARFEHTMRLYSLTAPTTPAHDPGHC